MNDRVKGKKIVQVVVIQSEQDDDTQITIYLSIPVRKRWKINRVPLYMNIPLYSCQFILYIHPFELYYPVYSFHDRPAIPFHGNQHPVTEI